MANGNNYLMKGGERVLGFGRWVLGGYIIIGDFHAAN
jgi:hypothetical protein